MKERNITDSLLYKILQYVYFFFMSNFCFLISNIIFFLALLYFPISLRSILFFAIALVPSGPGLTALFYTMRKLHVDKTVNPVKDYYRSYRENFWISLRYWAIQVLILTILIVDVLFVLDRGFFFLTIFSLIICILFLLMLVNGFSILSTFEVGVKNLMIFSVLLIGKNIKKNIINLLIIGAFSIIFYGFPSESLLFIFSVAIFYLIRNNWPLMKELKVHYSS